MTKKIDRIYQVSAFAPVGTLNNLLSEIDTYVNTFYIIDEYRYLKDVDMYNAHGQKINLNYIHKDPAVWLHKNKKHLKNAAIIILSHNATVQIAQRDNDHTYLNDLNRLQREAGLKNNFLILC